jgi:hypothetical protein
VLIFLAVMTLMFQASSRSRMAMKGLEGDWLDWQGIGARLGRGFEGSPHQRRDQGRGRGGGFLPQICLLFLFSACWKTPVMAGGISDGPVDEPGGLRQSSSRC